MKSLKYLISLFVLGSSIAQTNTEIYHFDLSGEGDATTVLNGKNISNSAGYDSQPYFLGNNTLIYAGARNGNTEIITYKRGKERIFNKPTEGGEYSPQPIPGGRGVSAVRLDPNGYQRLYTYKSRRQKTTELVTDAVVAYYVWHGATTLVAADIVDEDLHLVIHNVSTGKHIDLGISVGRSFHKIPDTELISFIDKTEKIWVVRSIHPITQEIKEITPLISGTEDIAWLPDGNLLATKGNALFIKTKNKEWATLRNFDKENLTNLSRVAVSPDGSSIAIVAEIKLP